MSNNQVFPVITRVINILYAYIQKKEKVVIYNKTMPYVITKQNSSQAVGEHTVVTITKVMYLKDQELGPPHSPFSPLGIQGY